MGRIFVTGDTHGDFDRIEKLCSRFETTKDDLIIILGDAGINYWGGSRDRKLKKRLEKMPITFFLVRGNHESRPSPKSYNIKYIMKDDYSGHFLVEKDYPSLLFAMDGARYSIRGWHTIVIGGAYSVDKYYRLEQQYLGRTGYRWFYDEQLSQEERDKIFNQLKSEKENGFPTPKVILSHTCPFKNIPREMFLPFIDQSTVDDSMEHWLDDVDELIPYKKWFCGHWHIDKKIDKMVFLFEDVVLFDDVINKNKV